MRYKFCISGLFALGGVFIVAHAQLMAALLAMTVLFIFQQ